MKIINVKSFIIPDFLMSALNDGDGFYNLLLSQNRVEFAHECLQEINRKFTVITLIMQSHRFLNIKFHIQFISKYNRFLPPK